MKLGKCIGRGRAASVYEWGSNEVVKLFNEGFSIGNEAENCRIINSLGIPSPEMVGTIEIDGCAGIIFERINGITMTRAIEPNKDSISKYAGILAELHVLINSMSIDYPSNVVKELTRSISYSRKIGEQQKKRILEKLSLLPEGREICHYDFHSDNIIMSQRGPVVIDWANMIIGNSLADASRTSVILGSTALPPGQCPYWLKDRTGRLYFQEEYLNEYFKLSGKSKTEMEPWIVPVAAARQNEGIEEEKEYLMDLIM